MRWVQARKDLTLSVLEDVSRGLSTSGHPTRRLEVLKAPRRIYRLPPLPPTHLAFDESMFGYSLHWFPRSALLVKRSSRTSNLLNGIVKTVGILAKIAWRRRKRKAHRTSACSVIFGRSKRRSRQRASGIGTSGESARIVRRKACVAVSVACI